MTLKTYCIVYLNFFTIFIEGVPTWLDIVPPALKVSVLYRDASEIDLLLIVVHLVAAATTTQPLQELRTRLLQAK